MSESLYTINYVVESDLQDKTAESVRSLLVRCFPWTKEFETQPFWQIRPRCRFLAHSTQLQDIVGHIALFERVIQVNRTSLKLVGLGLYAIDKMHRGSYVSKVLIDESHKAITKGDYDAAVVFTKHGIVKRNLRAMGYIDVPGVFRFTYPDGGLVTKNDGFVLPINPDFLPILNKAGTLYAGEGTW